MDILSRTGILIAYFDYKTKEYSVTKDSEIQIHNSFDVFFDDAGLKKEFESAKNKKKDIRNKIVKYENKYFAIDTFEEDEKMKIKFVDISGVYQSKINATKDLLVLSISFFRKNPILTGVLISLLSAGGWYIKYNIGQIQRENFRLSQELKEINVKFMQDNRQNSQAIRVILQRLETQDSVNRLFVETQFEMIKELKDKKETARNTEALQEKLINSEKSRMELMADNTFMYVINSNDSARLDLQQVKEYAKKYIKIQDSINKINGNGSRKKAKNKGHRKEF